MIDNIGIPKHKKTRLLSLGTKLFITFFELKGFSTWGERIHNISMMTFPSASPTTTLRDTYRKASVSKRKSTFSFRRQNSTNWLFSNLSPRFRCVTSLNPWSHPLARIFIVTSLIDTSVPRAREHLRPCLHLTNPCAKRKFLSLTKPKGKIYKTKSLGHYITCSLQYMRLRILHI